MRYHKSHILVVDDEYEIRYVFKESLEESGYACHVASSGDAALQVLATETVDLALVDIMMPGMSGLTLFERIMERYPDVAVIFITGMNDVNIAVRHLKHGACDYLVKPVTLGRLKQAVEETLDKRNAMLGDSQATGPDSPMQGVIAPLSQREMELLRHLGQGRSNKDIAHALNIAPQTVKNHITSIFRKLDVNDRTQAVLTGLRYGWISLGEGSRGSEEVGVSTPDGS